MEGKKSVAERKKGGRPSRKPDTKMLLALYEEHTSRELGELFDVSAGTVRAWVNRARKEVQQNG